jgi:hypothetical protein
VFGAVRNAQRSFSCSHAGSGLAPYIRTANKFRLCLATKLDSVAPAPQSGLIPKLSECGTRKDIVSVEQQVPPSVESQ